ncbi:nucleotidyltransferase domain-containing protein [Microbacterium sp. 22303]|uniref:nucleotidyltransferase domain-containing protein n=1 Tax=Microbacterium sp. 22303 TaxID=3453905 RepID=UPI003F8302E6
MVASPSFTTEWDPLSPGAVADLLASSSVRWWLSGGAALDRWLGRPIRARANVDVSTTARDLRELVAALPSPYSAWIADGDGWIPLADAGEDVDAHPILIHDESRNSWVLQVNAEDGADRAWVYKRDPRLQLPWDRAVLDLDGIPTGAPEVQLVWKALRPRPEDDADKEAVLPELSTEARAWWERAILTIHPHSTWSIHVRSPFAPAKASWNRPGR